MGTRAAHESRRGAAAIVLAAVLLLALAGCEFFTATAFPEYVSSITAERSVGEWIDSDSDWFWMTASADVIENRLFLQVEDGVDGNLVIFDSELDVEAEYRRTELDAAVIDTGFLARRAGFSGGFQPVVGGYIFNIQSGSNALEPALGVVGLTGSISVQEPFREVAGRYEEDDPDGTDTVLSYVFWIDNGASPAQMHVEQYMPTWSSSGSNNVDLGGSGNNYHILEIISVFEGTTAESFLVFLIGEESADRVHVVFVSYQDFPPLAVSMMESAGSPATFFEAYDGSVGDRGNTFVIENADPWNAFIASAGIIVRSSDDDEELRLHGFDSGGKEIASFSLEGFEDVDIAVPFDGNGFYALDRQRERLYRLANFWE